MNKTARAIIFDNGRYIFMKRTKIIDGKEYVYYTTIGGHLENNETFEETVKREVFEEAGVNIDIISLAYEGYEEDIDKYEKIYNCKIISGKLGTGKGEEFTRQNIAKYGKYEIVKIEKKELKNYNILPINIKEYLIDKEI